MKINEIKVHTIKEEVLLKKFFKIDLQDNQSIMLDNFCIYKNLYMIDIDCCFSELFKASVNNNIETVIDICCRIKTKNKNGGVSFRMDKPDFIHRISLNDYLKYSKELLLIDFIRYNYNPRIVSNQNLLIQHLS